jgi:hypothetical protein
VVQFRCRRWIRRSRCRRYRRELQPSGSGQQHVAQSG